jgi:hypothetical protein
MRVALQGGEKHFTHRKQFAARQLAQLGVHCHALSWVGNLLCGTASECYCKSLVRRWGLAMGHDGRLASSLNRGLLN